MRAAVVAGQFRTAAGQVDEYGGRDVVEVGESGVRRKHTSPGGVHRIAGIDVAGGVGIAQAARQLVCPAGQVGEAEAGPPNTRHGQHVETGIDPGRHQAVTAPAQPDHRCVVEPQCALDEGGQVVSLDSVRDA